MTFLPQALTANILTVLIFLPLAGVFLLFFLPKEDQRLQKNVTFAVTLAEFLLSLPVVILHFPFHLFRALFPSGRVRRRRRYRPRSSEPTFPDEPVDHLEYLDVKKRLEEE